MSIIGPQDTPDWTPFSQVSANTVVLQQTFAVGAGGSSVGTFYVGAYETLVLKGIATQAGDAYSVQFAFYNDNLGAQAIETVVCYLNHDTQADFTMPVVGSFVGILITKLAGVDNHGCQIQVSAVAQNVTGSGITPDLVVIENTFLTSAAVQSVYMYPVRFIQGPVRIDLFADQANYAAWVEVMVSNGAYAHRLGSTQGFTAALFNATSIQFYAPRRPWRLNWFQSNAVATNCDVIAVRGSPL